MQDRSTQLKALLFIAVLTFSGCSQARPALRLGMVPSTSPAELTAQFEQVRLYLEKELNTPVILSVPDTYGDLIKAMKNEEVDIGLYGAFSYIAADRDQDLIPLIVRKRKEMGVFYSSLIIVRSDSPFTSIEDLQNRSFAFVDEGSTSGYVIPYALFSSRNIDIASFFSSYSYAGSHDIVAEKVLHGNVDAGAISKSILLGLSITGKINDHDIRVIWESEPIPGSPFIARAKMDARLREDFVSAMLGLDKKAPDALHKYSPTIENYVPIEPGMYNSIRNIVSILGEAFIVDNYLK